MPNNQDEDTIFKLINNFFLKASLLICSNKSNLNTDDIPTFDDSWYHQIDSSTYSLPDIIHNWIHFDGVKDLPPLVIETYLDIRSLPLSSTVRLKDADGNLWNVCKGTKKKEIVLQRWLLELDNTSTSFKSYHISEGENIDSWKQLVLLLHYLHTLIQLLPVNELLSSLQDIEGNKLQPYPISVETRLIDGSKPILSRGRIGLSKPIISTYSNVINESNIPSHLDQKKITPVWTKFGLLRVSVSYRYECRFQVDEMEANSSLEKMNTENIHIERPEKRSLSLSPRAKSSVVSSLEHSFPKKSISISKQVQPFKVGSINSTTVTQLGSQPSSRNPSNSSVFANGQTHRSSIGSNIGTGLSYAFQNNLSNPSNIHVDSTSIESGSKFISSFGNIRRHSSISKNVDLKSIDRTLKGNSKSSDFDKTDESEELLDFVRLIDDKPEIKINKNGNGTNSPLNISNSLLKYQNLKPSNDMLSDDLSMSISVDPIQHKNTSLNNMVIPSTTAQRRRSSSNSYSPVGSVSPSIQYTSLSSRIPSHHPYIRSGSSVSRRSSLDRPKISNLPPIHGGESSSYGEGHYISTRNNSNLEGTSGPNYEISNLDEDLFVNHDPITNTNKVRTSTSPRSIDSLSSSFLRNRLPYRQPYHYSQPTIVAVPAHAKLHRPSVHSTDILEDEGRKLSNDDSNLKHSSQADRIIAENNDQNEDDDLVFFMSDMNLCSKD